MASMYDTTPPTPYVSPRLANTAFGAASGGGGGVRYVDDQYASAAPSTPVSAAASYQSIFGPPPQYKLPPAPQPIDPRATAEYIQSLYKTAPPVRAPVVTPAQVNLPGGAATYQDLAKSIYASQFGPVSQQIAREEDASGRALKGELAQAGLADSGSGVGQEALLRDNFDNYLQNASQNIAASAEAAAINAEIGVATGNAQLQQQARLANAGFDLTAQEVNAQNILNGNGAAANAYLTVLGLNAQQAESYRQGFLSLIGINAQANEAYRSGGLSYIGMQEQASLAEQQNELAKDSMKQAAAAQMMNFYLQNRSLDLNQWQIQQAASANAYANANNTAALQVSNEMALKAIRAGEGGGGSPVAAARQAAAGQPTVGGTAPTNNAGTNTPLDMGTAPIPPPLSALGPAAAAAGMGSAPIGGTYYPAAGETPPAYFMPPTSLQADPSAAAAMQDAGVGGIF